MKKTARQAIGSTITLIIVTSICVLGIMSHPISKEVRAWKKEAKAIREYNEHVHHVDTIVRVERLPIKEYETEHAIDY